MAKNNKRYILVIIFAVLFGLLGGIAGEMMVRVYLAEDIYNLPLGGEINFPSGLGSGLVIRNPKKVVVEQNDKVIETINSTKGSLVGIFKKGAVSQSETKDIRSANVFDLKNFYKLGEEVGEGLIITSDGWIITSFKPDNLNYVVISQDRKIYPIDKMVSDPLTPFYFIHVQAQDFPVRKFAERNEIQNGQLILAVSWQGESQLNSIANSQDSGDDFLFSSDLLSGSITLVNDLKENFYQSFLFNLYGDVVGAVRNDGSIEPIYHFKSSIISLLKNREVKRPSLGVNYVDLSRLINLEEDETLKRNYSKGALIYKSAQGIAVGGGSAAAKAGLRENDIIISVEGIEINKDNGLADVIQGFAAGDDINLIYNRQGEEKEISVVLGEMEAKK